MAKWRIYIYIYMHYGAHTAQCDRWKMSFRNRQALDEGRKGGGFCIYIHIHSLRNVLGTYVLR